MRWFTGNELVAYCRVVLLALSAMISMNAYAGDCASDVDGDGVVGGSDITAVLSDWGGASSNGIASDIDGSGRVDGADLALLLASWNSCVQVPSWATLLAARPNSKVVTDPTLRAAIDASGLAWRVRDRASGIEMLLVPAGTFMMGANPIDSWGFPDESPVHLVKFANHFYLGRCEVTQGQFEATMGFNPSWNVYEDQSINALRPVESTSYDLIGSFLEITGFNLPTEAQWEYACRAGTTTPTYAQVGQDLGELAWYSPNSDWVTHPVGQKAANPLGFHDMLGNVWEWCADWYGGYSDLVSIDPQGPAFGQLRIIRGGSWYAPTSNVRSPFRGAFASSGVLSDTGFRVARQP